MHWVVQENLFREPGYDKLISTLERFGISHTIVSVNSKECKITPDVNPEGNVIVMGAVTMWKIAKAKGWFPGSFINADFDSGIQVQHWKAKMFNHDCYIGLLSNIPTQTGKFFIRPAKDSKVFTGHVTDMENLQYLNCPKDVIVQVSSCKDIYAEYRLWIINNDIVTASRYVRGGVVSYSDDVEDDILSFGQDCINEWTPAKAFCLDVFRGEDGPKIGEVNNINSAGFYAADVQKIIM